MKAVFAGVLLAVAMAVTYSLPAALPETDVVVVPLEELGVPQSREDVEDIMGASEPSFFSFPFGISFPNVFQHFDAMFRALTNRVRGLTTDVSKLGPPTNSTSTQKVIDGHIVTVNETTYQDDKSNTMFFVRVVDVQPSQPTPGNNPENENVATRADETTSDSQESTENTETSRKPDETNEIPKAQIEEFTSHEHNSEQAENFETHEVHDPENFDVDNSIDVFNSKPIDLKSDIYVNMLTAKKHGGIIMVPSDVEVFDVHEGKPIPAYNWYPDSYQKKSESISL